MDLVARGDSDHVVALFKRNGCWGAISKSNHVWLRWRDPVYRSLRELAMSYAHEYFLRGVLSLAGPTDADDGRNVGRAAAIARFGDGVAVTARISCCLDHF